jgi:hypothetical protein
VSHRGVAWSMESMMAVCLSRASTVDVELTMAMTLLDTVV